MLSHIVTPSLLSTYRGHYSKLKLDGKRWVSLLNGKIVHKFSPTAHLEFLAGFHPREQELIAGKSLSEMALGEDVEKMLDGIKGVTQAELDKLFSLI